jgi:hypothetical protein
VNRWQRYRGGVIWRAVQLRQNADQNDDAATRVERVVTIIVAITFIGANVYYFHRWAFRFSSANTSSTYTDTPDAWKLGKYVLMALVIVGLWTWLVLRAGIGRQHLSRLLDRGVRWPLAFFLYAGTVTAMGLTQADEARQLLPWFFFLPVVLAIPVVWTGRPPFDVWRKFGIGLVAYHVMFLTLQVVGYFVFDKVPALSYRGGLLRFGGGLDDPNGFAMLVVLPLLLTVTLWRSFSRTLFAAAVAAMFLVMLVVPSSFSALIGCVAGLASLAVIMRRPRILLDVVAGVSVAVFAALLVPYVRDTLSRKSESARGRFDFDGSGTGNGIGDYISDLTVAGFLFGSPNSRLSSENAYVLAFSAFGVIGLGLLLAAIAGAIRRGVLTARRARDADALTIARTYEALSAYLVAFCVASLGVPFFDVFPTNMAFWIVAAVAAAGPAIEFGDGDDDVDDSLESLPLSVDGPWADSDPATSQ